jgi:hypothetical protein
MISPEYFLHASNITRVFSVSAKDVLWLRVFAILSSLIGLRYFYLQATILWESIARSVLFMTINAYHVWRLWMERRPVELSSDEARLYNLTFFALSARQFVELARLGRWTDQKAGDVLLRSDEPIGELAARGAWRPGTPRAAPQARQRMWAQARGAANLSVPYGPRLFYLPAGRLW